MAMLLTAAALPTGALAHERERGHQDWNRPQTGWHQHHQGCGHFESWEYPQFRRSTPGNIRFNGRYYPMGTRYQNRNLDRYEPRHHWRDRRDHRRD
jgi:hypothetical protein